MYMCVCIYMYRHITYEYINILTYMHYRLHMNILYIDLLLTYKTLYIIHMHIYISYAPEKEMR